MSKTAIVAFAFGAPGAIRSNKILCEDLSLVCYLHGKEIRAVFTQQALELTTRTFWHNEDVEVLIIPQPHHKNHPSTLKIAKWAIDMCIENGIDRLLILAATPHLSRCILDVLYAINIHTNKLATKIEVDYCSSVKSVRGEAWFCRDSAQSRTRSSLAWWLYELPLRLIQKISMALYAKIAG